jgi:D-alanyl-D-alanine carboxypeptidase
MIIEKMHGGQIMHKWTRLLALTLCFNSVFAASQPSHHHQQIAKAFLNNFNKFKQKEYYSGATLSYMVPGQKIENFYLGSISHDQHSGSVSESTLFEIGSITKSFTAALILQLEEQDKLSLADTIKKWLPRYAKWNETSVRSMLNMTSGLPNYSDTPRMNSDVAKNPMHVWTNAQLIDFVYPPEKFSPPLKQGYFYSNTNYILLGLIIEKIAAQNFEDLVTKKLFQPADLKNTFYPVPTVPDAVQARLASGYNYNQYDNPDLLGKDMRNNDLSWAGAAGAIVSTSEDVIKWVNALYKGNKILQPTQAKQLKELVSQKTGKPIRDVDEKNGEAFGLGVARVFDKTDGAFWFYEGQTLGFRAAYIYKPCNGVVVSAILNSATNSENDHMRYFLMDTYKLLLQQHSSLRCR